MDRGREVGGRFCLGRVSTPQSSVLSVGPVFRGPLMSLLDAPEAYGDCHPEHPRPLSDSVSLPVKQTGGFRGSERRSHVTFGFLVGVSLVQTEVTWILGDARNFCRPPSESGTLALSQLSLGPCAGQLGLAG